MRSLQGTKDPEAVADLLIVHPSVRRMLLTQKAITEGGRAMLVLLVLLALLALLYESSSTTDAKGASLVRVRESYY